MEELMLLESKLNENKLRQQQMAVAPVPNLSPRQIAALLIKQEADKERLQKQVENITLVAKGKARRKELGAKVSNVVRMVAHAGKVAYDKVWRRLYRQFNANHKRWWWGDSQQAKNHWDYIVKIADLSDLENFLSYALSYIEEINKGEFWVD